MSNGRHEQRTKGRDWANWASNSSPQDGNLSGQRACLFVAPELTINGQGGVVKRVPLVVFKPDDPNSTPCSRLVVGASAVIGISRTKGVSLEDCLLQRQMGICPRGLGLDVPNNLRPR